MTMAATAPPLSPELPPAARAGVQGGGASAGGQAVTRPPGDRAGRLAPGSAGASGSSDLPPHLKIVAAAREQGTWTARARVQAATRALRKGAPHGLMRWPAPPG